MAPPVPGAADAGRIDRQVPNIVLPTPNGKTIPKKAPKPTEAPDAAKTVMVNLANVELRGVTAFSLKTLQKIYKDDLGKPIPISRLWDIANKITNFYHENGYFLSRAYVPAQEVDTNGGAVLHVIEGYVGDVVFDHPLADRLYVKLLLEKLRKAKPLNAKKLESLLLQLNDIPGRRFNGVIEPLNTNNEDETTDTHHDEGAVRLTLSVSDDNGHGLITLDNFGSRFIGPYQGLATYQRSLLDFHQTRVSGLFSLPWDELKYGALQHDYHFLPKWNATVSGSFSATTPGDTLETFEIESQSTEISAGLTYQLIRQRTKNLTVSVSLDGRNTDSEFLGGFELTKDRIRAFRAMINFDSADRFNGYNTGMVRLSQGLPIMGASGNGDLNLSRGQGDPTFTSVNFTLARQQSLFRHWLITTQFAGQLASSPLLSAEEFGYGGQDFGRAYDPSEITGDHGLKGGVEISYIGLKLGKHLSITPYGFYDIGRVWNKDIDSPNITAASTGLGMRFAHTSGIGVNAGIAWPLIRTIGNPIYGGDGRNPRILLQTRFSF